MLTNQSNICDLHSNEAVVIEYKATSHEPLIMLCSQCLIDRMGNKNMFLMKDANQLVASIQQQCFSYCEEGINQKIQNLQQVTQMVAKLKAELNTSLDNISNALSKWINQETNLKPDNFSTSLDEAINKEEEYRQQIQVEFENLSSCEILKQCIEYFSLIFTQPIDFQILNHEPHIQTKKTPNLDLLCQQHQMEIIMFDLNENQAREKRILCIECDPIIFTSLTKVQQIWNNYLQNQARTMEKFFLVREEQINTFKNQLLTMKKVYDDKINYLVQQLNLELANVKENMQKILKQMNQNLNELSREQLLDVIELLSKPLKIAEQLTDMDTNYKRQNEYNNKISFHAMDELEGLQNQLLKVIDGFLESQNPSQIKSPSNGHKLGKINVKDCSQFDIQNDSKLRRSQNRNKQQDSNRKQVHPSQKLIDYQIIYTRKEKDLVTAIAFNKDGTLFLAGCKYDIKIWDFHDEKMTYQCVLKVHTGDVNCIFFSKKENMFISASDDQTMRIWVGENNEWKCTQNLNEHDDWIVCFIVNQDENELISGSRDTSIKVWVKQNNKYICRQTLIAHKDGLLCLSYNDSESLFVSCSYDKTIIIWIRANDRWEQYQVITEQAYGHRLCFIGDDQFVWQPYSNSNLQIYELKETMFEKIQHNVKQIEAKDDYLFFPSIYLKSKQMLINRHYRYIYIIRKFGDQFNIEQIIEFEDYRNFATLSLDGEYLATWDYKSGEFQIRKNVGTSNLSEFI